MQQSRATLLCLPNALTDDYAKTILSYCINSCMFDYDDDINQFYIHSNQEKIGYDVVTNAIQKWRQAVETLYTETRPELCPIGDPDPYRVELVINRNIYLLYPNVEKQDTTGSGGQRYYFYTIALTKGV